MYLPIFILSFNRKGQHRIWPVKILRINAQTCLKSSISGTPAGLLSELKLMQGKIIRQLLGCSQIGMDIVEVSPPYGHAEITSLAAATLALELLYVLAASRKKN